MRRLSAPSLFTALAVSLLSTSPRLEAQQRETALEWAGPIAAGRSVLVRNVNGGITVQRSSDGQVHVTAEKRWRRSDPTSVRVERITQDGDVVLCALWRPGARCDRTGGGSMGRGDRWDDNDVSVHFTLQIPDGVRADLVTVNGAVSAQGLSGDIDARTVNGAVTLRGTSGALHAATTNGGITAEVVEVRGDAVELRTVNGGITVQWPSTLGAQLDLRTVNGGVSTDFTVTGVEVGRRPQLRTRIGDGRVRLTAHTVNGGVTVKKR